MRKSGPTTMKVGEEFILTYETKFTSGTSGRFDELNIVGMSMPAVGTQVMWARTGKDREGNVIGGFRRWYELTGETFVLSHQFIVRLDGIAGATSILHAYLTDI